MAQAFQCDRCGRFSLGSGEHEYTSRIAWDGERHSYDCAIAFIVSDFHPSGGDWPIPSPVLCKGCLVAMMEKAINTLKQS